jgi:hypothetical protein
MLIRLDEALVLDWKIDTTARDRSILDGRLFFG